MQTFTVIGIIEESLEGYSKTVTAATADGAKAIVKDHVRKGLESEFYVAAVVVGTPTIASA